MNQSTAIAINNPAVGLATSGDVVLKYCTLNDHDKRNPNRNPNPNEHDKRGLAERERERPTDRVPAGVTAHETRSGSVNQS